MLATTGAPEVRFSVSGIREGFFFDLLEARTQKEDALLASASDLAALIGRTGSYGRELYDWMTPLFNNEPIAWRRIRRALCKLSELAWSIDPNFRANWAYQRIIQSSLKGLDHKERLMLALALYYRYQARWKGDKSEIKLLDERERLWARCVGMGASLAFQLSGGRGGNLYHAQLAFHDGQNSGLCFQGLPLPSKAVCARRSAAVCCIYWRCWAAPAGCLRLWRSRWPI